MQVFTCTEELPSFPQLQWPSVRVVNEVPVNSPTNREDTRNVAITLETNEDGLLPGLINEEDGSLHFKLNNVDLVCKRSTEFDEGPKLYDSVSPINQFFRTHSIKSSPLNFRTLNVS
jgi:hypothetical protein